MLTSSELLLALTEESDVVAVLDAESFYADDTKESRSKGTT